jgi:hypothetical protein
MKPNYYPHGKTSPPEKRASGHRTLLSRSTDYVKPKPKARPSPLELFRESRQALVEGDTGMSQILLAKAVDDSSYGQTQYALDMVFLFSTEPATIKGAHLAQRDEAGRLGRLMHLKSLLDYRAAPVPPPMHTLHARNFFNTVTGWYIHGGCVVTAFSLFPYVLLYLQSMYVVYVYVYVQVFQRVHS